MKWQNKQRQKTRNTNKFPGVLFNIRFFNVTKIHYGCKSSLFCWFFFLSRRLHRICFIVEKMSRLLHLPLFLAAPCNLPFFPSWNQFFNIKKPMTLIVTLGDREKSVASCFHIYSYFNSKMTLATFRSIKVSHWVWKAWNYFDIKNDNFF